MDEDRKVVDLSPMEYKVRGEKRRESILARGWYWGVLAIALVFAIRLIVRLTIQ